MLNLKEMENTESGLRAVYTVRHNTEEYSTILEQDLHLVIDPKTGAVKGSLVIENLMGEDLGSATEKLAEWCDRLAAALREPMKVVTSVPVFAKDWEALVIAEQKNIDKAGG